MRAIKSFLATLMFMLLALPATAAVQWTQLTYKDGNPSGTPIRPNISCDGKYVYYVHSCRIDDCSGDQDEGSVYQVRTSNLSTTRIVSSAVGDDNKCLYVSADETGDTLAIDATDDLSGDTPPNSLSVEQIYIRNTNGSINRLTAYESHYSGEGDGHKPNISCDGSTVCWTHDDTGFCCNTASCVTPTQIGTAGFMTSISPGNDGSTYVVMTTENLTGDPIPPIYDGSPQMYYFNGST
mgnify:FL=1